MTSEKKFGRKWTWPKVKILVKYLAESGIWPKVVFGQKYFSIWPKVEFTGFFVVVMFGAKSWYFR